MKIRRTQAIVPPARLPTPSQPVPVAAEVPGLVLPGGTVLTPAEVTAKLDAESVSQLRTLAGQALAAAHPLAGDAWSATWLVIGTRRLVDRWGEADDLGDAQLWLDTASALLKAASLAGKHVPAAQPYLPALATVGMIATTASGAYKAVVDLEKADAGRLKAVVRKVQPAVQKA